MIFDLRFLIVDWKRTEDQINTALLLPIANQKSKIANPFVLSILFESMLRIQTSRFC